MASASRRLLDAFLRDAIAPLLRDAGYTRSGHTWRRAHRDAIAVVAVAGSRWNDGIATRFGLVAALWYPAVARRLRQRATSRPQWWQGHVRWSELGRDHLLAADTKVAPLQRRVRAELRRLLLWIAPRTAMQHAWRSVPRPPHCPPSRGVESALRVLAGRKPARHRRRVSSVPMGEARFAVLEVRPG